MNLKKVIGAVQDCSNRGVCAYKKEIERVEREREREREREEKQMSVMCIVKHLATRDHKYLMGLHYSK